jgi:hypothetical protein
MSRRINTTSYQSTGGPDVDKFWDRVIKNIPADIVGAWVAVTGLISSATDVPTSTILWITFVFGIVLTFVWTWRQTSEPGKKPALTQTFISTGSFIVWVFALGGPFATMDFYRPLYGSLLLIGYSLLVSIPIPPEK